jgi:hypothetical protein
MTLATCSQQQYNELACRSKLRERGNPAGMLVESGDSARAYAGVAGTVPSFNWLLVSCIFMAGVGGNLGRVMGGAI